MCGCVCSRVCVVKKVSFSKIALKLLARLDFFMFHGDFPFSFIRRNATFAVFYSSRLAQFRVLRGILASPYIPDVNLDPSNMDGAKWWRVCEESLVAMAELLESALAKPETNEESLDRAILGFYRVRECLLTDGASEGFPAVLWVPEREPERESEFFLP